MLDSVIIIGVIVALMAILRLTVPFFKTEVGELTVSLIMLAATGGLNILNGIAFSGLEITGPNISTWLKDGIILGAAAGGIYSMGKSATETTVSAIKNRAKRIR